MNTPTPRTDEAVRLCKVISSAFGPMVGADDMEKLERELNEARLRYEALLRNYNADTISLVASERDQLRKMVDAFAECVGHGDEWLMADYRDLPHVRARKTK
jgi:hypothetical protein